MLLSGLLITIFSILFPNHFVMRFVIQHWLFLLIQFTVQPQYNKVAVDWDIHFIYSKRVHSNQNPDIRKLLKNYLKNFVFTGLKHKASSKRDWKNQIAISQHFDLLCQYLHTTESTSMLNTIPVVKFTTIASIIYICRYNVKIKAKNR